MNTPTKWVNTEPDAGAPHALLERLGERVPPRTIDEIWIFATRRIAIGESTVFVVAARAEEQDRSRVITARYAVTRNNKGVATVQEKIDEHGTTPAGAVARIVQGVLRRMGEEGEQAPREERIEGDLEQWWTLVEALGGRRGEEASTDEASTDEASTDEASTDEPRTDEPRTDEPSTDEPRTDEPRTDEPSTDEPSTDEPSTDEPSTDESPTDEPSTDVLRTDGSSTDGARG